MWETSGSRTSCICGAGLAVAVAFLAVAPLLLREESHGIKREAARRCALHGCKPSEFMRRVGATYMILMRFLIPESDLISISHYPMTIPRAIDKIPSVPGIM